MAKKLVTKILKRTVPILLLLAAGCAAPPVLPPKVEVPAEKVAPLQEVGWGEVDGWQSENPAWVMDAYLTSCRALRFRPRWKEVCSEAEELDADDAAAVRAYFESRFTPYRLRNPDGSDTGTITGYYVPDLEGSRHPSDDYPYPLYGVPDDLLVIDLDSVYPELAGYRLRGRLEGRRVVPYWRRDEIDAEEPPLRGEELFWVKDRVELFFLQIQGSGRINLDSGERIMVSYADQNGHPYRSIGKYLLDHGEMTRNQMSMQNIRAWARSHPQEIDGLLGENPSYVFFRELDPGFDTPPGALGVALTPMRSLAVDPRTVPLGAPVFLSTTWPNTTRPFQRLMVAQDTGGAIKGPVRADFFWGVGDEAGERAGRMKQQGRLWVLLPNEEESPGDGPPVAAK